jgi:hypothetical protein
MTEVLNQATPQTTGFAPSVVLSFACDSGSLKRPSEEQPGCGDRLEPLLADSGGQWVEPEQIHDVRSSWIGVDLDGTLASDTGGVLWDAEGQPKIGRPVDQMVVRIKRWTAGGQTVKIFTARASSPVQVRAIRSWLARYGLPDLEVTNVKDFNLIELWDDRCVEVTRNSGRPVNQERRQRPGRSSARPHSSHRQKSGFGLLFSLKRMLAL